MKGWSGGETVEMEQQPLQRPGERERFGGDKDSGGGVSFNGVPNDWINSSTNRWEE